MPDDDDARQSEDEVLEEDTRPDDIYNPVLDEETLADDYDPPATAAPSKYDRTLRTHPISDDSIDRDELYNEGLGEATSYRGSLEDSDNSPPGPLEPEEE